MLAKIYFSFRTKKPQLLTKGELIPVMMVTRMAVILAEVLVLQVLASALTRTALVDPYVLCRNLMELLKQKKELGLLILFITK